MRRALPQSLSLPIRAVLLAGIFVAASPTALAANLGSVLPSGGVIHQGDYLVSPVQKYFVTIQGDCNMVVYGGSSPTTGTGQVMWNSQT